jgi:carotenoid cleavage dioxygenase-like enzyme
MSERSELKEKKPFWLTGNFAPVFEETTSTDLEVTGEIPSDLNGHYLRNGANPPSGDSPHWFLGAGMIHGVELKAGKALGYRNRYMRTPAFEQAGSDPLDAMGNLSMSLANTHVVQHAGKILSLEEAHYPFQLTRDLESVGPYNFDGKLDTGMTAHPKICPETGEMLFFSYSIVPPYLTYHRVTADGALVQSEQIEVKGATMAHDFNATRNHVIFMDLPLVWDMEALASGLPIRWSDDYGARLGVMPRDGSNEDVVWYEIDPCYVFHPMNAYEDGHSITIDVCRLAEFMKPGSAGSPPRLHQWTIDRSAGRVTERPLDDRATEFPRIPNSRVGLPYRYGYVAELGPEGTMPIGFRKYDMRSGASTGHALKHGQIGGEPVFVPAAGASAEDDGYLLSYVYDPAENRSELVILDASQLEKDPIARVHLPVRVPAGFHGSWIADPE